MLDTQGGILLAGGTLLRLLTALMPGPLLLLIYLLFFFPQNSLASSACDAITTESIHFPSNWFIQSLEVQKIVAARPDLASRLALLSHLARFIEDSKNEPLLVELGLAADLDFTDNEIERAFHKFSSTEEAVDSAILGTQTQLQQLGASNKTFASDQETRGRILDVYRRFEDLGVLAGFTLTSEPEDRSLYRFSRILFSTDPHLHASLERLGPHMRALVVFMNKPTHQQKSRRPHLLEPKTMERLHQQTLKYFAKQKRPLPSLRTFYEHFLGMHYLLEGYYRTKMGFNGDQAQAILQAFRQWLKGEPVESLPPRENRIVEQLVGYVSNSAEPKKTIAQSRRQKAQFLLSVAEFAQQTIGFFNDLSTSSSALFQYALRSDAPEVFIDHGLTPLFEAWYTEVILGAKVLSAKEVRVQLRHNLLEEIKSFREEMTTSPTLSDLQTGPKPHIPPLLTRAERLAQYEKVPSEPKRVNENTPPTLSSPLAASDLPEDHRINLLRDRSLSLSDALDRLKAVLTAGEILTVSMRRNKLVYRFTLSQSILDAFAKPAKGQPRDFREWFDAFAMGPARDDGERGWKKRVDEHTLDWEIKVLHSPSRLFGYRDGVGVWHFVAMGNEKR